MDLRRQIAIVRAWFPLFIVSVVLAGGAAFVLSNLQERTYEAKATLIVGQSLTAVNPDYTQLLVSQRLSTTYATVATTRPTLESVIDQLDLQTTPDALLQRVRADAPADSTLLTLRVQDTDPAAAAAIANAIADQLIAASPAIQGREAAFLESMEADLKATQNQIASTQAEVEELVGLADRTAAQDARLETLQGRLVTLRATYASLLAFSSSNSSSLLTVIEPAFATTDPVAPKPLLNTLLAAAVGLLIAMAIAFIAEYLDDRVRTQDEIRDLVGLSTLGSVARMGGDRGRSEIYRLATLLYPRSGAAEAYRTLRTNIEFASVDAPVRTLLVTSAVPGEGKSVTAANLAVAFAQAGRQVLLIDADLRKPGVHVLFDLPNAHGLTTLLRSDQVSVDAIVHSSEQANLRILTTGPLPPNPAELLGSQRMQTILEGLKGGGELLVFDSPPLQAVTDSAILSSFVDGTLLVIDARRSRRRLVRLARETLARAGANVLGAVLNQVRSRAEYAGYYGDSQASAAGPEKAPRAAGESPGRTAS